MEPSCHGFTMVLVFFGLLELCCILQFFYMPLLSWRIFLHVSNSFVDSIVPVITLFFHFLNG